MTDSELIDHLAGLIEKATPGPFIMNTADAELAIACNPENIKRLLELARKGAEQ